MKPKILYCFERVIKHLERTYRGHYCLCSSWDSDCTCKCHQINYLRAYIRYGQLRKKPTIMRKPTTKPPEKPTPPATA